MICTKNIDSLVEASCNKLVVVVSDIRYYISIETVASSEYEILVHTVVSSSEPYSAVLFVSLSGSKKLVHDLLCFALFVNGTLTEPIIVYDTVFFKITLQTSDIQRQCVINKSLSAVFVLCFCKRASVEVEVILCVFDDIHTEINILRHFKDFSLAALFIESNAYLLGIAGTFLHYSLTFIGAELHISERERFTEFFDLIAGVVYIELSFSSVSCPAENACETVADSAASCISDMHGTCRICRNKFNENALSAAEICLSVVFLFIKYVLNYIREPFAAEKEVHEAWSCNFAAVKE